VIPPTINGLPAMAVLSCMQKAIRRNDERLAMQCAVELVHTSKAFASMVCNRLQIISHEDIDTEADPTIVPFVHTACTQSQTWIKDNKPAGVRMFLGNAIRLMCHAKKSRTGDHFQASFGLAALLEGAKPELPDWAFDMHTMKGKKMGRGLDHFLEEGCKLVPSPTPDSYAKEAARLWAERDQRGGLKAVAGAIWSGPRGQTPRATSNASRPARKPRNGARPGQGILAT
jgi:hypothetical protein